MLYNMLRLLADEFILFNLFRYITFRAGAACLTALIVSFLLGPYVIRRLKSLQRNGQPIRLDRAGAAFDREEGDANDGRPADPRRAHHLHLADGLTCVTATSGPCCS